LVVSATRDKELVRSIVLVLAGHAADEFIKDKEIEVRLSDSLLEGQSGPVFKEEGKLAILGLSSDMLREGVELVADSDIEGGARVRLVRDKLEIDLSDRAISRMISQRLLPRFKAILEGTE
jgi:V/A-type H+-transporting ATPase subunit E